MKANEYTNYMRIRNRVMYVSNKYKTDSKEAGVPRKKSNNQTIMLNVKNVIIP